MALIASIPAGSSYRVSYSSDPISEGASLLVVVWIPRHGAVVPSPQEVDVAPAATGVLTGSVPAFDAARRIEIRVDLPDETGSGRLTLEVNGQEHSSRNIVRDTLWTAAVDRP